MWGRPIADLFGKRASPSPGDTHVLWQLRDHGCSLAGVPRTIVQSFLSEASRPSVSPTTATIPPVSNRFFLLTQHIYTDTGISTTVSVLSCCNRLCTRLPTPAPPPPAAASSRRELGPQESCSMECHSLSPPSFLRVPRSSIQ